MRVSLAEIQQYAKTLASLSDIAAERSSVAITFWMTAHPEATVAECREFAIMAVRDAVARYGDAAAQQAATLYDNVMDAEGVDVPSALTYDGPDEDAIEGTVRRLAGKLAGDIPDADGFLEQVRNLSADKVRAAASETVMRNVERDARTKKGKNIRFARIPQRSNPCPWCVMLASRGFDYKSAKSAAAGSHHNCTCLVVPGINGVTQVDGYDQKGMYDRYKSCRKTIQHDLQPSWGRMSDAEKSKYKSFEDYCDNRVAAEMNTRDRGWLKTGKAPEIVWDKPEGDMTEHERKTVYALKANGFMVRTLLEDGAADANIDLAIGSHSQLWEMKNVGNGKHAVEDRMRDSFHKWTRLRLDPSEARTVLTSFGATRDEELIIEDIKRRMHYSKEVLLVMRDGTLRRFTRQ